MLTNYSEFQKLTSKDIKNFLVVSEKTAQKYYNDIKEHFSIEVVLLPHFKKYFKIEA